MLLVNGKFCAQRTTGVQRYAGQMLQALDARLAPGSRCTLLLPPGAQSPPLRVVQVRHVGPAGLPLHAWEQVVLPWAARGGLLLNLAGAAPLLARRQWCTFHDAAFLDHPWAYTWAFRRWYGFHFRYLARRAERLLTVSLHARARLALHLAVPPERLDVLGGAGDHLRAQAPDGRVLDRLGLAGCRWLLAIGSDNPLKNGPALRRAWAAAAPGADWRLVWAGGAQAAVFAGAAAAAEPPGSLRAGAVTDAELKALLQGAAALVFPSLDEGFGLPPLEAMDLGCAVAVARAGALPEVCGDAALYLDPRDEADITRVLRCLMDDEPLRQRLAAAGRVQAAHRSWAQQAAVLHGWLHEAGALA